MATDDEWEDTTGVTTIPVTRPGAQPRPSTQPGRERSSSARAALRKIDELGDRFEEHAVADRDALDKLGAKLDDHGETLSTLRESAAATNATLTGLTSELRHVRELELAKVEGEQKVNVEKMSGRTKVWLALIGVLSAFVTGLVTWLAK